MTNLEVIRPFIERFITAVSNSLRLEMAIFDGSCQLFYCTPTYSKKKGRSVHTPPLQEVQYSRRNGLLHRLPVPGPLPFHH